MSTSLADLMGVLSYMMELAIGEGKECVSWEEGKTTLHEMGALRWAEPSHTFSDLTAPWQARHGIT